MNQSGLRSVPRSTRRGGWTIPRQAAFLQTLASTRSVGKAARAAGMSRESAHRLRKREPEGLFAAMWDGCFASKVTRTREEIDEGHIRLIRLACGPEGASFRFDRAARSRS